MGRVIAILGIFLFSATAIADERTTIQNRFALKNKSLYAHVTGTTHIRDDFYSTYGIGIDTGFYLSESFGFEIRGLLIDSSLSAPAKDLKERTGLTPDARPQTSILAGGIRWSIGYGKLLMWKKLVLHFDPQFFAHGGVAFAEKRVLPTVLYGLSLLNHFRWGIQLKVDLAGTFQMENRDKGWTPSFGFLPMIGIGWNFSLAKKGAL